MARLVPRPLFCHLRCKSPYCMKACKASRLVGVSQVCGMSVVYTGIPHGVQAEVYVSEM